MSGLVGYGSSEEEDEEVGGRNQNQREPETAKNNDSPVLAAPSVQTSTTGPSADPVPASEDERSVSANSVGPFGPPQATMADTNIDPTPSSPYTYQRNALRNLTLPTNPNLDIPPSPSSSPTSADQKFTHFLELKKQGIHFNVRLASSSALKNPSILPKLLKSAGVDDQKQYATTLPLDLWDPLSFPEWAYKEELSKSQQEVTRRKEEERVKGQRERLDFVPAGNSTQSSRGGTPGVSNMTVRGSAAERVMAGLDRTKKGSPQARNNAEPRGASIEARGDSRSPRRTKR